MSDLPTLVERELDAHSAFVRTDAGYDLETTVFDVTVGAEAADGQRDGRFTVTVSFPTLSAAAADVAPVVEDDWARTFERRLADAFSVARTSTHDGAPTLERDGDTVRVIFEYVAWDASEGVEDAKTLVEYAEGTYAQGLIPGYEYRGAAATLLENAVSRGARDANDTSPP